MVPHQGRTIGARLRSAIIEAEMTVTDFAKQMDELGAPGTSYANVQRYLGDEKKRPAPEFMRAAAEVLGVRVEWLMLLDDEPTETGVSLRAVSDEVSAEALLGRRWSQKLSDALEEEMGGRIPLVAQAVVAHHWRRLEVAGSHMSGGAYTGEELVRRLARALVGPLREFDAEGGWTPDTLGALDESQRGDYLIGIVPVIARAVEHRLHAEASESIRKTITIRSVQTVNKEGE